MKATLISSMALPCLMVCFAPIGYSQQLSPIQQEAYHPRENISGVGTQTVVYHLPDNYKVAKAQELESHLKQYNAIDLVDIDETSVTIHLKEIISGKDVNMIFDRLGMSFFDEITIQHKY